MRRALAALIALGGTVSAAACASFGSSSDGPPPPTPDASVSDDGAPDDGGVDAHDKPDAGPGQDAGSPYRTAVIADAPVAYWRMGIAVGVVAIPDETGGGHTLYLQGTGHKLGVPGALAGDPDTAIGFDGVNSFAKLPDATDVAFPGALPFTVECFVLKPTATASNGFVIDYSMGSDTMRSGWLFYVDTTEKLHFEWLPGSVGTPHDLLAPLVPKWTYLVGVFDGTHAHLYVDGTETTPDMQPAGVLPMLTSSLYVGADQDQTDYFAGAIDEIAIYPRPLDLGRILAHFAASH